MIERDDDGDVAVLRLDHGPVSAMDVELCEGVAAELGGLGDGVRAVVLTGTGRSFSAGVDLRRFLADGAPYATRLMGALDEVFHAGFRLTIPMVAAVNGHAIAGGCVLAACADVVLMAEGKGRIGLPEVRVGVPFPRSALEVMRHAVGDVWLRRMVLGGRTYLPAEAAAIGLVDEVVAPGDLVKTAVARARALADEIPADTFALTKRQLRRPEFDRMVSFADDGPDVEALWALRATDGWTAAYLEAVTGGKG